MRSTHEVSAQRLASNYHGNFEQNLNSEITHTLLLESPRLARTSVLFEVVPAGLTNNRGPNRGSRTLRLTDQRQQGVQKEGGEQG
ncbi:hypothetical protein AGOR_G00209750 [Albula goreensis]|uniref:Uncharacterized protein n=1 Tax=Albula goreensis TaxID=1534307 RepID=A0A8T3CPV0_9TELE|nr:hypothetical protein AGOR_G00209750 [Albula goreensis]